MGIKPNKTLGLSFERFNWIDSQSAFNCVSGTLAILVGDSHF